MLKSIWMNKIRLMQVNSFADWNLRELIQEEINHYCVWRLAGIIIIKNTCKSKSPSKSRVILQDSLIISSSKLFKHWIIVFKLLYVTLKNKKAHWLFSIIFWISYMWRTALLITTLLLLFLLCDSFLFLIINQSTN